MDWKMVIGFVLFGKKPALCTLIMAWLEFTPLHLPWAAVKWNQIFLPWRQNACICLSSTFSYWIGISKNCTNSRLILFVLSYKLSALFTLPSRSWSQSTFENQSLLELGLQTETNRKHYSSLGWAFSHQCSVAAEKLTVRKWKRFSVGYSFLLTGILSLWLQVFFFPSLL